jgi:hypothetical protein
MSNVRVLRSSWKSSAWKIVFSDCLIALRPDINPDAIDEVADSESARQLETNPIFAAYRWAKKPLPSPFANSQMESAG